MFNHKSETKKCLISNCRHRPGVYSCVSWYIHASGPLSFAVSLNYLRAPHCPPSRSREGPCRSVVSLNASLGKRHLLQQQSPRTLLYGHPSTPQAQRLRLVALALERMEPAAVPVGYAQDSGSSWVAGALACKNRQWKMKVLVAQLCNSWRPHGP